MAGVTHLCAHFMHVGLLIYFNTNTTPYIQANLSAIYFQKLPGVTEVTAEVDLGKYLGDSEACRQCPGPSECSTQQHADHSFCPYLVLYGFNHVLGYVMVKCSARVNIPFLVCGPRLPELKKSSQISSVSAINKTNAKNIYRKLSIFKRSSVIKIEQSDFACPQLWHQMENMCFTLPHFIHTETFVFGAQCTCKNAGSSIHYFYAHDIFVNDKTDLQIRPVGLVADKFDVVLYKYARLLKETYHSDLLVDIIDSGSKHHRSTRARLVTGIINSVEKKKHFIDEQKGRCTPTWCFDQELCSMNVSRQEISCPYGFFGCKDQTCLIETSICDGQKDCIDGDDEIGCSEICSNPHPTAECTHCTIAEGCHCNTLYFQCSSGGCVSATAVCDGVVFCADGSDEAFCKLRPHKMFCETIISPVCGISQQINVFKQRCVFSKSDAHTDGNRHLQKCMGWQCSSMFKCDAGYCIPIHYICDTICDCLNCDDEYGCIRDTDNVMMSCPGMVKCKPGYPCVHRYNIHDGEPQCKDTYDDELKKPVCPAMCTCRGTAIFCPSFVNKSVQDFTAISAVNNDFTSLYMLDQQWAGCAGKCESFVVLDISNVSNWDIVVMKSLVSLSQIHVLNVSSNAVRVLRYSPFGTFKSIIHLYMQNCSIYSIESGVFVGTSLHILDLSHNRLTAIADTAFGMMSNLMYLILKNNQIQLINFKVFHAESKLTYLDLRNNEILTVSLEPAFWIPTLHLEVLYSDEQVLCCIIPTSKLCYPAEDKFQSCSTLLQREHNKYILGSVATVIIALNGGALVYIIFWKSHHRLANKRQLWSSGIFALTDTLLGIYVAGLVASDIIYGSTFGKYRQLWSISSACMLLETILMHFITSSSFLILHMSGVLLYSIIDISNRISNKRYNLSLISGSVGCLILSFLRRLINVRSHILEMNRFCLPFITRVVVTTSDIQLCFEWSWLIVQVIFVTLGIIGLSAVIWVIVKQQTNLSQNRRTSTAIRISKLIVYICMVMASKIPWLMIWFCVLIYVQIVPDVLLLVYISTLSIWPIVHPFLHTIGQGKY